MQVTPSKVRASSRVPLSEPSFILASTSVEIKRDVLKVTFLKFESL